MSIIEANVQIQGLMANRPVLLWLFFRATMMRSQVFCFVEATVRSGGFASVNNFSMSLKFFITVLSEFLILDGYVFLPYFQKSAVYWQFLLEWNSQNTEVSMLFGTWVLIAKVQHEFAWIVRFFGSTLPLPEVRNHTVVSLWCYLFDQKTEIKCVYGCDNIDWFRLWIFCITMRKRRFLSI